jgi:hypothetical protein
LALASLAHSQLLKNAAWGLWFRVITGSGVSMVDLATDINVIRLYFKTGKKVYGSMLLGMVLASMGLQLLVVVVQNRKAGWRKLLRETLIVVSGLKPGIDAMRVVMDADMEEYHLIDAKTELVLTKGAEMFCESIPGESLAAGSACLPFTSHSTYPPLAGCILQVYALVQATSSDKMTTQVLSIVTSAITTGMSSASVSCACSVLPRNKSQLPSDSCSFSLASCARRRLRCGP